MTTELLPGVSPERSRPAVRCNSRSILTRARRTAIVRECIQAVLIIAIDVLFVVFPNTHVPLMTRGQSMNLLLLFHAVIGAQVLLCRMIPVWRARRIASSWSADERRRLSLG